MSVLLFSFKRFDSQHEQKVEQKFSYKIQKKEVDRSPPISPTFTKEKRNRDETLRLGCTGQSRGDATQHTLRFLPLSPNRDQLESRRGMEEEEIITERLHRQE